MSITNAAASKVLGEKIAAPLQYEPSILVRVPRFENRESYGITGNEFVGFDTWNCFEVSVLTENGLPITGVGKLVYKCDNPWIVESKSLKLYLNSFSMSRFGKNTTEAIKILEEHVIRDLSALLETDVMFKFYDEHALAVTESTTQYKNFPLAGNLADVDKIVFTEFNESPEILVPCKRKALKLQWNGLYSNCRVTNQPDTGTIYIEMYGKTTPTVESLMEYIASFRRESHFHEECCEMAYKRLHEKFQPDELMVTALYQRRGGIDINPARATHKEMLLRGLADVNKIYQKTPQQ